jgi:hypothetical protein
MRKMKSYTTLIVFLECATHLSKRAPLLIKLF